MSFYKKCCIISGAGRGIGKAISDSLLKRGARCLVLDQDPEVGEQTVAQFASKYGKHAVAFAKVDVSSQEEFEAAFIKCRDTFGGIDIMVNNAGVNGEIEWEKQMHTNLFGAIRGSKLALKYMAVNGTTGVSTAKGGTVLNIASSFGVISWPMMPTYSAAKAGIITYTKCAGHVAEYGDTGVKMMCFFPFIANTSLQDTLGHIGISDSGLKFLATLEWPPSLSTQECGENAIRVIENGTTASTWFCYKSGEKAYPIPDTNTLENLLRWKPMY